MHTAMQPQTSVRALSARDLEAVVAIDAALLGRSRRAYFLRRLNAALTEPELHVQFAATDAQGLAGYILARRTEGEFGRTKPGLRLEVLGVHAERQGRGVGRSLLQALCAYAASHGIAELRTLAAWNQHRMLAWLDAMGFELAPDLVLECAVGEAPRAERNDALALPDAHTAGHEVNYGAPEGNDHERVERQRCDVRAMRPQDLAPVLRIDRELTGRDRAATIEAKLGEAMNDSAIRVSLTARLDHTIVGFLMARADLGDYGRTEPVAVLDTLGVDPAYGQRGVGRALLAQLFVNLGALYIDRVETVVTLAELPLAGFLHRAGFARSRRLAFVRAL